MFSIPLTVVEVGGLRYTTVVGKDWKDGKWGTSDHGNCIISLSENLESPDAVWHTWLHEWLHCVHNAYGIEWTDEAEIDAMASAVLQLVKQLFAPRILLPVEAALVLQPTASNLGPPGFGTMPAQDSTQTPPV